MVGIARCVGKTTYLSPQEAHRVLRHRERAGRVGGGLSVYRCEDCGKWHLGRNPVKRAKKIKEWA